MSEVYKPSKGLNLWVIEGLRKEVYGASEVYKPSKGLNLKQKEPKIKRAKNGLKFINQVRDWISKFSIFF